MRIGTAEIYRKVEQIDAVPESIAIGESWADDVRVVLFVVLRKDTTLSDDLVAEIRTHIVAFCVVCDARAFVEVWRLKCRTK